MMVHKVLLAAQPVEDGLHRRPLNYCPQSYWCQTLRAAMPM